MSSHWLQLDHQHLKSRWPKVMKAYLNCLNESKLLQFPIWFALTYLDVESIILEGRVKLEHYGLLQRGSPDFVLDEEVTEVKDDWLGDGVDLGRWNVDAQHCLSLVYCFMEPNHFLEVLLVDDYCWRSQLLLVRFQTHWKAIGNFNHFSIDAPK